MNAFQESVRKDQAGDALEIASACKELLLECIDLQEVVGLLQDRTLPWEGEVTVRLYGLRVLVLYECTLQHVHCTRLRWQPLA